MVSVAVRSTHLLEWNFGTDLARYQVGRMMMNIRGLRQDHPKYTLLQQTGKLSTSDSAAKESV